METFFFGGGGFAASSAEQLNVHQRFQDGLFSCFEIV